MQATAPATAPSLVHAFDATAIWKEYQYFALALGPLSRLAALGHPRDSVAPYSEIQERLNNVDACIQTWSLNYHVTLAYLPNAAGRLDERLKTLSSTLQDWLLYRQTPKLRPAKLPHYREVLGTFPEM